MYEVVVFPEDLGIRDTRYMAVMIEADYLVKLIEHGAIKPPFPFKDLTSRSLKALKRCPEDHHAARHTSDRRVWFVPAEPQLAVERGDRTRLSIIHAGIILRSEEKTIYPDGRVIDGSGESPVHDFAREFTTKFEEFKRLRVFRELQNIYKLTLVARLIHRLALLPDREFWLSFKPAYYPPAMGSRMSTVVVR
jgi:hypothetical protein